MSFAPIPDIAYFIAGIALIVLSLACARYLRPSPMEVASKTLGSLKIDLVALLVVAGVAMTSVGVFFRWQDYETKLQSLGQSQSSMRGEIDALARQIDRFRSYDVNVALQFKESIELRSLKVQTLVKRPGGDWALADGISPSASMEANNLVSVKLRGLNPGDFVRFRVEQGKRAWRSRVIEVPVFTLDMDEVREP